MNHWDITFGIAEKVFDYLPSVAGAGAGFYKGYAASQGHPVPDGLVNVIMTYGATAGQAAWSRKQAKDYNDPSMDGLGIFLLGPLILPLAMYGDGLPEPEKRKEKSVAGETIKGSIIGGLATYLGYAAGFAYGKM